MRAIYADTAFRVIAIKLSDAIGVMGQPIMPATITYSCRLSFAFVWLVFVLKLSIIALTGCAMPLPVNNEGINDEQLLAIELGETHREEVVAILGEPDIIWETERVLVYKERPAIRLLWIIPAGYTAAIGMSDLGDDVVIVQFDATNRARRLQRRSGVINGDFLRRWVSEQRQR